MNARLKRPLRLKAPQSNAETLLTTMCPACGEVCELLCDPAADLATIAHRQPVCYRFAELDGDAIMRWLAVGTA